MSENEELLNQIRKDIDSMTTLESSEHDGESPSTEQPEDNSEKELIKDENGKPIVGFRLQMPPKENEEKKIYHKIQAAIDDIVDDMSEYEKYELLRFDDDDETSSYFHRTNPKASNVVEKHYDKIRVDMLESLNTLYVELVRSGSSHHEAIQITYGDVVGYLFDEFSDDS